MERGISAFVLVDPTGRAVDTGVRIIQRLLAANVKLAAGADLAPGLAIEKDEAFGLIFIQRVSWVAEEDAGFTAMAVTIGRTSPSRAGGTTGLNFDQEHAIKAGRWGEAREIAPFIVNVAALEI